MRWRIILLGGAAIAAAVVVAAVVYAQLGDTQTASGTVNVTTTSADLYICEPDTIKGPACGSDDSGGDETIFETLEDMLPGDQVSWDIRLKNVGSEILVISGVGLSITETVDPGADCPNFALQQGSGSFGQSSGGVFILGKNGDSSNDNPDFVSGFPQFKREGSFQLRTIGVAPGDYEDLRLRLRLNPSGTDDCDGNEWNASWQFTALPVSFLPTSTFLPTTATPTP